MSIRIMLVDDHIMISDVLSALLAREADMEVVAAAKNGRDAVRLAREIMPDVIVMDVAMPELNGLEACRQIMADNPGSRILFLSMHGDRRYVVEALKAGARGYIQKSSPFKMLVGAIRSVAENYGYLDPNITGTVMDDYLKHLREPGAIRVHTLSHREKEILQLIAEGKSTREISSILDVSGKTIESHRRQIMKKLKLTNVADLTRYAIREGITSL